MACAMACAPKVQTNVTQEVEALIDKASKELGNQEFDKAMEFALQAQKLAKDNPELRTKALATIVGIDIMASRDADAWEKALEAEKIARDNGLGKELAGILISKAKLCSYAEISPETGRNDEGLGYAQEALRLAREAQAVEQEAEACYVIGSLYINKNRWKDPIDKELYRKAGEYIGKGQEIADNYGIQRLRRNGILFRSRWFQQGGRNEEAIRYFEEVLKGLSETDYVTAAALDDRLVRLYIRTGDPQKALDTHDDYVYQMQKYLQQKEDETLQEMETRFEVQEKERSIERGRYHRTILTLALILALLAIISGASLIRRMKRRNKQLEAINNAKEQIIEIISKDLGSPSSGYASKLEELQANPALMNEKVAAYVEESLMERARKIADIGLSQREIQIIRLSAEGLKASEIAERTFLSVHTVNTHRQRIYAKMGVKNVSEMMHKAAELGIV